MNCSECEKLRNFMSDMVGRCQLDVNYSDSHDKKKVYGLIARMADYLGFEVRIIGISNTVHDASHKISHHHSINLQHYHSINPQPLVRDNISYPGFIPFRRGQVAHYALVKKVNISDVVKP